MTNSYTFKMKIKQNRLRWFGHVGRKNIDKMVKEIEEIRIKGNRRKAEKSRSN